MSIKRKYIFMVAVAESIQKVLSFIFIYFFRSCLFATFEYKVLRSKIEAVRPPLRSLASVRAMEHSALAPPPLFSSSVVLRYSPPSLSFVGVREYDK